MVAGERGRAFTPSTSMHARERVSKEKQVDFLATLTGSDDSRRRVPVGREPMSGAAAAAAGTTLSQSIRRIE